MQSKQTRNTLAVIYLFIFVVIFFLTCLTPMLADDYSYCFSYANGERIKSISDVFESLVAHRYKMNGRIISHCLTMLFLLLPKVLFNIANAANSVLLLYLCTCFYATMSKSPCKPSLVLCTASLIWIFMPVFGQVFLWLDGSLN